MKLPIYAIVISLFLSVSLFTFLTSVLFFGLGLFFFVIHLKNVSSKKKGKKKDKKKSLFHSFS